MIKRAIDVGVSCLALLVLLPVLAAVAIAIRLTSPGPVLYRGVRVGRNGGEFRILKFRSMVVDAESRGGSATANDDPRVTPIGRLLRRYKLDELPQFFNVLVGDMSLVGPRPEVRKYVDCYTEDQRKILQIRPGITDWATIWNSDEGSVLAGSQDAEAEYERVIRPTKLALQLSYLQTQGTLTDARILCVTIAKLVRKRWVPRELAGYGTALDLKENGLVGSRNKADA
jgi:lipopolysaccharide/colanic/teichoic acid biosynthesis glycosyltransferase